MSKLKKYRVDYSFDGRGYVFLKATSEQDARNRFYEGFFDNKDDHDRSENYCVEDAYEAEC